MSAVFGGKFCHIHIPKTGGTWVRLVLQKQGWKPKDVAGNHEPAPDVPYLKFCFVRDPADWLRSWWGHEQRHGWPSNPNPSEREDSEFIKMMYYLNQFKTDDLAEFVHAVEEDHPGYVTDFFSKYTKTADRVGRTETLMDDFIRFTGLVDTTFEPYNVTPIEYRPDFPPGVREFVLDREDVEALVHG